MLRRWLFAIILLLTTPAMGRAMEAVLRVDSQASWERYRLTPHMLHFEDIQNQETVQSVSQKLDQFQPIEGNGVLIQSPHRHWLRLTLSNQAKESRAYAIANHAAYTDSIDLYTVDENGIARKIASRGDRVNEENKYRLPLFEIDVAPGTHDYYFCLQTEAPANLNFILWDRDTFYQKSLVTEYSLLTAGFGIILVMVIYNSFLSLRLRNRSFLFYAGYMSFFFSIEFLFCGLPQHIFPNHPIKSFLMNSGVLICAEVCAIFCCLFARTFLDLPKNAPLVTRLIPLFFASSIVDIFLAIFFHRISATFVLATNVFMSSLLLAGGFRCAFRRHRPAYFYLVAWLFFILGNLFTMASIYGFLPANAFTTWAQLGGGVIESVLLSLALGDKISLEKENSHAQIQKLNHELSESNLMLSRHVRDVEAIVEEKTRDIRSIMDHIPIGIFMIGQDQSFHKDTSRSLDAILPWSPDDNALDLLFSGSEISDDEKSQIRSSICASLNELGVNFEVNAHLLPRLITRLDANGERRIFDLTWNAIESRAGICEKILVTIRDITDIRRLEEKSSGHLENAEIIAEILNISAPVFVRFVRSARMTFKENAQILEMAQTCGLSPDMVKLLFINMHTIKGSSRSLYLRKITSVLHDSEQVFAQALQSASTEVETLAVEMKRAQSVVDRYAEVAQIHLGRSFAGHKLEFEKHEIETVYQGISALPQSAPFKGILMQHLYREADAVFHDIFSSVAILAKDLKKEQPRIRIETAGLWLNETAEELFRNVFVHLIRNTMDHGLETAERRAALRKSLKGTIDLQMVRQGDRVKIHYEDDGRGLATGRILRSMSPRADYDFQKISEMVFTAGFSTAVQVSDISGRGVGMNAVRKLLGEVGGSVGLVATEPFLLSKEFHAFAVVIDLPFDVLFEQRDLTMDKAS